MFKSLIAKCEPSGTYYTATMVNLNWLSILAEGESRAGKASDQAHTNTISGMEKQDKNQKIYESTTESCSVKHKTSNM